MIPFGNSYIARLRRRYAIGGMRKQMALMGCPLDGFTDEEIEDGVAQASKIIASVGVSASEAYEAFRLAQKPLDDEDVPDWEKC